MTPTEAAQTILAALPRPLPPATLAEYGVTVSPDQARRFTRELLSLCLFWVRSALQVAFKDTTRARIYGELRQCLAKAWASEFGQDEQDLPRYFEEAEARRRTYDQIMQEGGSPVMIATEAAAILVEVGAVPPEDRTKALALLVDVIPVDEIGQLIADLEVGDG
ncbi:hypothetical protein [Nitrospira sp. Kam-Ns4a]